MLHRLLRLLAEEKVTKLSCPHRRRLAFETMESRELLSVSPLGMALQPPLLAPSDAITTATPQAQAPPVTPAPLASSPPSLRLHENTKIYYPGKFWEDGPDPSVSFTPSGGGPVVERTGLCEDGQKYRFTISASGLGDECNIWGVALSVSYSGSYGHGNGDPPVAITQALTIAEEDSDHFHFSSFQGIPTLRTDATSPSTLDTSVDVYLNVGNDFVPETAEKIIVSIDYVAIGSQYADANAPYGYVNNGGRLYEAFNFSETVDIQDDDQWEITASVTDDEALEPCTWIPGNQRRGAFELRKDRGENCEDSPVATTVEFTLGGSASESGLPRGYYLTTAVE